MEALGDYAKQAAPYLLLVKRGSHSIQLANFFGARFVASAETDEGRRLGRGW
jgi:phage/plasmid-associated DNA primase